MNDPGEEYEYFIEPEHIVLESRPNKQPTLNDILAMPSESLLDKILEYAEEYEIDVSDIAELFEKNKEYKELLYVSLVENHVIIDKEMKELLEKRIQEALEDEEETGGDISID
jgi:hypothetical protein